MPPDKQEAVRDFVESLTDEAPRPKQKRMRLTWAGALRDYRGQYTSLELQKKAWEWVGD